MKEILKILAHIQAADRGAEWQIRFEIRDGLTVTLIRYHGDLYTRVTRIFSCREVSAWFFDFSTFILDMAKEIAPQALIGEALHCRREERSSNLRGGS